MSDTSVKVVHVDDDSYFIEHFREIVIKEPTIKYEKGFTSVIDGYDYVTQHTPDVLFIDVEMPGHNGFWLAERIKHLSCDIVFVTSHAGYALKAFEACAIDYLLKPITEVKIQQFLERYQRIANKKNNVFKDQLKELVSHYLQENERPSRIFINTAGRIDIVNLDEVLYFSSKGNFTEVVMKDGTKYSSGKTIKTYEDAIFKNTKFLRIHRSVIVNKVHIKAILKDSKRHRFAVVMSNSDELEISFLRKEEIFEVLLKN